MLKRVAKILLETAVYVGIVIGILWGVPNLLSKTLGTEYPIAAITSGSMWPVLKQNYIVLIKAVPKETLAVGDIVVWQNERGFTIHRIITLNTDTLVTKGDANFTSDDPIAYSDIVGRTVMFGSKPFRIPFLGSVAVLGRNLGSQAKVE